MNISIQKIRHIAFAGLLLLLAGCSSSENKTSMESTSPSSAPDTSPLHYADPTIFFHQGTYYLYGTVENKPNTGFEVF